MSARLCCARGQARAQGLDGRESVREGVTDGREAWAMKYVRACCVVRYVCVRACVHTYDVYSCICMVACRLPIAGQDS